MKGIHNKIGKNLTSAKKAVSVKADGPNVLDLDSPKLSEGE